MIYKHLPACKPWEFSLYHLKILQRFHNGILFFLRTLRLLGVFRFGLIVIFPLNDAIFLLHLRNIEFGYLQLVVLLHIIPDCFVGGLTLGDSHVQFVHAMSRSAMVSCNYHRFPDRNSFAPPAEQPLAFCLNIILLIHLFEVFLHRIQRNLRMRSFVRQKALPGIQPRGFFVGDAFQNLSAVHTKGIQHPVYHLFGLRGKRQSALLQRHKGGIKQRFVVNRCIDALNIIQQQ